MERVGRGQQGWRWGKGGFRDALQAFPDPGRWPPGKQGKLQHSLQPDGLLLDAPLAGWLRCWLGGTLLAFLLSHLHLLGDHG